MKLDLKRVLFASVTAGMLAVTGCAGNVPENNHGNRTGENLGNNVNRAFNGGTRSNYYDGYNYDGYNYGTRSNYNNNYRNYRNNRGTDNFYNDTWNNHSNPAGRNSTSNTLGNQLRRYGRTTGRTANVTAQPNVNRTIVPGTNVQRNNWNGSVENGISTFGNPDFNRGTINNRGTVNNRVNRAADRAVVNNNTTGIMGNW